MLEQYICNLTKALYSNLDVPFEVVRVDLNRTAPVDHELHSDSRPTDDICQTIAKG